MEEEYENFEEQTGLPIWKPEQKGEKLEGKIVSVKAGNFGKQYVIQILDDIEIATPSHKVLQNRLQAADVGDKVKIEFIGLEPTRIRGQNPMAMYKVELAKKKKMPS